MINKDVDFVKDAANKKLIVTRMFDATRDLVWRAWTESELLDLWWAPKPYKTETKHQEFKVGGHWLYSMVSPEGERHWCRLDYLKIDAQQSYDAIDTFCDEEGNRNTDFPRMSWHNEFHPEGETTKVVVNITFEKEEDIRTIMEMGFREGFTAAMTNLDHYLATGFMLRKEMKKSRAPRVTTYLNFPGTTEEAFLFYRQVFKGEFTGNGLRRFGDIDMPAEYPPMKEEDKKLIIHAELTILGGHVLMATDSPESMGFKMQHGNNMHINLEPGSREETERLFKALSEGGEVSMPLTDMFWGAYFASFTDKYGINWMLNFQEISE